MREANTVPPDDDDLYGPILNQRFLTDAQLAAILQVKRHTLYMWRRAGTGPRFVKLGRMIRYPSKAVREWMIAEGLWEGDDE